MGSHKVRVMVQTHSLGLYSYSATTFIFYVSFNFDFRFWPGFTALIGYFWGWCLVKKTVLGSTHGVEKPSFSMIF